jgi:tRNA(Ile)-lysidine synthase
MALLTALHALRSGGIIGKDALFCLHVEHGLRPAEESKGDAEFVRLFCQNNSIECRIKNIPPGKIARFSQRRGCGIEAAARFFRHKAFSKEAKLLGEKAIILLAHTKDDLLETALMRILRGAGPAGLAAMPAKRGRILRPLLKMTRADVTEYLKAKNISWREDSTNTDTQYLRNKIRHKLIPLLNELFPSWKSGIFNMAQTQSFTAAFIASEARACIKWDSCESQACIKRDSYEQRDIQSNERSSKTSRNTSRNTLRNCADKMAPISVFTDAENFFTQSQIIREEAVFLAIDELLVNRKNFNSVKRVVVRRFCAGEMNAVDLGSVKLSRVEGKIVLSRKREEFFESGVLRLVEG